MKIRDLNLDDYVIVYDIGKSEYSDGMTVVGRVDEIIFNEDDKNEAGIDSLGNLYEITDDNHFYLWSNYIESKMESLSDSRELNGFTVDEKLLEEAKEKGIDELRRNMLQSNDVQQRKRSCGVNGNKRPDMIRPGEPIISLNTNDRTQFIEQVVEGFDAVPAYNIGKAIEHIFEHDSEQAKKSLERAYENWD
ncbi:hypothetical protein [Staphylococcus pseudoxylosus]|uniref:Uncharacterized protein n=1 Tax=Staphylococcus pseudoxylosus TaxID=2282419 RepID=A0AAQ0MIE4_9STAP|nr:hypothetical protein [Staphylococcus pseudoxylosus]MCE5003379.1 hypothetical protein [Staphylococcus pseudoxylosus]RMI86498.1 hypothetical protein D9V42_01505 [Staphylococcus pseudoxylosus]